MGCNATCQAMGYEISKSAEEMQDGHKEEWLFRRDFPSAIEVSVENDGVPEN